MRLSPLRERGDTLIEVLVAVVALSIVVTLAYTIMTRSFAQGQISLERTTTQGMVAAQISMLRDTFARHEQAVRNGVNAGSTEWSTITKYVKASPTDDEMVGARTACEQGSTPTQFYFNPADPVDANRIKPKVFEQASPVVRDATSPTYGDGMWIEGYKIGSVANGVKPYYDFYVKACWDAAISGERQQVVTNVRFYEVY